jgi:DNA invertase Pin-like site-specific DNA recombinase
MGNTTRVVGYIRVSTGEQGTSGTSLVAQRDAIRCECERRGWDLTRIEQDVLSGRTMRRAGLQAALEACRAGEVSGLVVAKLDRLSRSIIDFATLLEEARRRGFNIAALDLGLDLSTPQGELVANVIASVAQWERRIIGQRTREALAVKRALGVKVGRPRSVPDALATELRQMRSEGASYASIAETLNSRSVPTGHGGRKWYPATVRTVVSRG